MSRRGEGPPAPLSAVGLALLVAAPAWTADEVLLRFDTATDRTVVAEVSGRETGVSDGAAQVLESTAIILARFRPASGDTLLYDEYDLGGSVRMTLDGEPVVDSPVSSGFGSCETIRLTASGFVLERDAPEEDSDPLTQLSNLLENYSLELPARPVRVGDRWERPNAVALGDGSASVLFVWSVEGIEERDGRTLATLHCRSEASVKDLQGPTRPVTVGEFAGCTRRDFVHEYSLVDEAEITWDVAAGHAVAEASSVTASGRVTQEYVGTDGAVVSEKPDVTLERQGRRTVRMREPTDAELVLAAAFAFSNCLERGSFDLLESVASADLDLRKLGARFSPLFGRFAKLTAAPSGIESTIDGDAASVRYRLSLVGEIALEGHALDVGAVEQSLAADVTIDLAREGSAWRVRAVTWQGVA